MLKLYPGRLHIAVTERQAYILKVRELAKGCCEAWLKTAAGGAGLADMQPINA